MMETIYLGYLLNVNPFGQPNVEYTKWRREKSCQKDRILGFILSNISGFFQLDLEIFLRNLERLFTISDIVSTDLST